ncbi:MAG: cysteine desulfurase [Candidatus Binatia bacterium]|nr:MAG: cysteine desulfurase [Candidatus Binatia bacterium]
MVTKGSTLHRPMFATEFDVERVRQDFPILHTTVYGKPLVYLDNAATTQKPRVVIDAICGYYQHSNANIHRGLHFLAERATEQYEGVRRSIQKFIGAPDVVEIVFTRGTTEALNLVASSLGSLLLRPGDEIVLTTMEHHSNIVPWQLACRRTGASIRVVPITDAGELCLDVYERLLGPKTKIVSVAHVSNALGTVNPVRQVVQMAKAVGAVVVVDGAQAVPHLPVNVQELGCDFYAFSGHKLFGPTGIGVLWGRAELLDAMPPYQGGGEMIRTVSFEESTWAKIPHKFEAGTPPIAEVIGLGAAITYVQQLGYEAFRQHEQLLLDHATRALCAIPGVRIIGTAREKAGVVSFVLDDVHPHDIGTILDREGIAIRAGHHCAQPLMHRFGLAATARASFAFYNTLAEAEALAAAVEKVREVFL